MQKQAGIAKQAGEDLQTFTNEAYWTKPVGDFESEGAMCKKALALCKYMGTLENQIS